MARCAWLELVRLYNGTNNGRIVLSAQKLAERLGRSKSHAARALLELEVAGFIATETIGTFTRRDRKASEYRLTHLRCDVSQRPASKEFQSLSTVPLAKYSVPPMGKSL